MRVVCAIFVLGAVRERPQSDSAANDGRVGARLDTSNLRMPYSSSSKQTRSVQTDFWLKLHSGQVIIHRIHIHQVLKDKGRSRSALTFTRVMCSVVPFIVDLQ